MKAVGINSSLIDLPEEALHEILSYLSISDLGRVAQVCKQLNTVSGHNTVWRNIISESFINTQDDKCPKTGGNKESDSGSSTSLKEQCRVSFNWQTGKCWQINLKKFGAHLMPWIQLDDDNVYLSQKASIKCHQAVSKNGKLSKQPKMTFSGNELDLCRFVIRDGQVIAGGRDHHVLVWDKDTGQLVQELEGCTDEAICVDMAFDVVIAGARNGFITMWNKTDGQCKASIPLEDRVWSIQANPWQPYFASGTSGITVREPLKLWDIQSGLLIETLGSDYRKGAGILDIQWETPHTLLACGYDTFIRLWDTRASYETPVLAYEEPDDYTVYCMDTDRKYLIASGSSHCGMVRLWDKRMTETLQNIYIGRNCKSPVYSVQFNATHLYAALSDRLNVINFTVS